MTIAPVTEVIITVQFASPSRPLNPLEIADFYNRFSGEFPGFDQISPAGPMAYKLSQLDGSEPIGFVMPAMPRLRFSQTDGRKNLLFQTDRVSFGWQRTVGLDEEDDYPGFEALLDEFSAVFARVASWLRDATGQDLTSKVGEIAYVNAFQTRLPDGEKIKLSEIYSFLNASPSGVAINGYSYSWNERLHVADGLVSVSAEGPVVFASATPATMLSLTGTFLLSEDRSISEDFLAVRARIHETFDRVVVAGRRP